MGEVIFHRAVQKDMNGIYGHYQDESGEVLAKRAQEILRAPNQQSSQVLVACFGDPQLLVDPPGLISFRMVKWCQVKWSKMMPGKK